MARVLSRCVAAISRTAHVVSVETQLVIATFPTLVFLPWGSSKRAQVRNEILVRGDEIQAELAKGWSAAAIWKVLTKTKEITCSYKTFVAHVRRLQHQA